MILDFITPILAFSGLELIPFLLLLISIILIIIALKQ